MIHPSSLSRFTSINATPLHAPSGVIVGLLAFKLYLRLNGSEAGFEHGSACVNVWWWTLYRVRG